MDSGSRKLRQVEKIPLSDTIIAITCCPKYLAVGCLDDSISLWPNTFSPFAKDSSMIWRDSTTGLIDLKFSNDGKQLATSSMGSAINIYDNYTEQWTQIQVAVMGAWKLTFVADNLVSCGDFGHIVFYDISSRQVNKKLQGGETFLTCIANCSTNTRLATGNNIGELFVVNLQKKDKVVGFKPHYKMVRSLSFSEDESKILSGSDDSTLKVFDIVSQKVISSYDGHKETVSCVKTHPTDNKTAFSCSFDKSLKVWDLRMKNCVDTFQSGSALWAVQCIGKNLVVGGENGVLTIFSIE